MEDQKPVVSVVVPVYNASAYLDECVQSLMHQTLQDTELIFVDDGSTDKSAELIEQYQRQDSRIQIYRQKNQYAGVARNNGMAHASGKYILFLDADDFFESTMLEAAVGCAEKNDAEIVLFDHFNLDNITKEKKASREMHLPKGVFSPLDLTAEALFGINGVPWNKLFLRSFIEGTGLQFQSLKNFNDVYFTKTAMIMSRRMIYLRQHLVYYRINNAGSLQGNVNKKVASGLNNMTLALIAMKKTLTEQGLFHCEVERAFRLDTIWHLEPMYQNLLMEEDVINARIEFDRLKLQLVPVLFESPDAFKDMKCLTSIYESLDFEDFLVRLFLLQERERNRLLQSKDFLIGRAVLKMPRKIYHWLKK